MSSLVVSLPCSATARVRVGVYCSAGAMAGAGDVLEELVLTTILGHSGCPREHHFVRWLTGAGILSWAEGWSVAV